MTLKCGKNKKVTQEAIAKGVSNVCHFLVLATFDVICDLLLNRHKATWNLFIKQTCGNMEPICFT